MRLRELRKLVEQVVASGGGGFALGDPVDKTDQLGNQQNTIVPDDETKLTLVECTFHGDGAGTGLSLVLFDDEAVAIRNVMSSNGGDALFTGTLQLYVPAGLTYGVHAQFGAPGSEYNMGATGVNVYALREYVIG